MQGPTRTRIPTAYYVPSRHEMKKLLLAGGAGFIGSHLVDRLLKRNDLDMLVVVDSLWTGRAQNVDHIRDQRLVLVRSEVEHFKSDFQFDEIFHLASPASPPVYMREPERTVSANLIGAMRLLKLLKKGGRICFASSSEVYGNPLVNPLPETYRGSVDCTGPRSSYDEGKRCTEALLFESNRVRGVDVRVARIFNVYGPRTRADDGRAVSNFIANAGGVICASVEYRGGSESTVLGEIARKIADNTKVVLARSREGGVEPRQAAVALARERVMVAQNYRQR